MILVLHFDLKFLGRLAQAAWELQIGGTIYSKAARRFD
jgi:hypothetical protein